MSDSPDRAPAGVQRSSLAHALARRLRLGELVGLLAAAPVLIVVASVVVGISTLDNQTHTRNVLLDDVEPAQSAALRLTSAMLNQETGIRGYQLTGRKTFLEPYYLGLTQQRRDVTELGRRRLRGTLADLDAARTAIQRWETGTALPAVQAGGQRHHRPTAIDTSLAAKAQFDAIRSTLATLESAILAQVRAARTALQSSSRTTLITLGVIAGCVLLSAILAGIGLQRLVTRPLGRLTAGARRVASGDLEHHLELEAPRDIEELADDVDDMRRRMLRELETARAARAELAAAAEELERSNAELEQFAYVASHDLQEPLRKVTSFCQLLQARYGGQLDERADQYIGFAVDGAQRMQQLISDLLAFSRVGRRSGPREPIDLGRLAAAALADLQGAVEASGATVELGELPTLPVEPSLLRAVFQNLIGNAIKFHGEASPHVTLTAEHVGAEWQFACADNGIGIEPEYAERIFVIFQRLHTRDAYPGTGIGLAMCRKIIEYHGGRIWLDTAHHPGTRLCFTLPEVVEVSEPATIAA